MKGIGGRTAASAALMAALFAGRAAAASADDAARWRAEAARVSIVRDDWGIAHVHGRSDADAVFGASYAEAEDDFGRIEANYLTALGRTAEVQGKGAIWADLRERLYTDPAALKVDYASSPPWLKALMDAWADGLNLYLATHPQVRPKVLARFEPWMALSFTEGSIGGDVEKIPLAGLQAFYGRAPPSPTAAQPVDPDVDGDVRFREPGGSNGIAIAPSDSRDGHTLLLINPHTSFYFRSELQMTSEEGLNAYGASTWGQFFIYQGFNPHIGWMHTTSGVDAVDDFAESVVRRGGRLAYRYGGEERPLATSSITVRYRTGWGGLAARTFTVYRTHHGPIVRAEGGRWIATALMNAPVAALSQSFLRTKATDYASFLKVAETYKANSSNNTVFADDKGEIAFLVPQFIPRRDDRFAYTRPVDGADPASDWKGLTPLAATPHLYDPPTGWIMNTNDWPYSAAGPDSPRRAAFPRYMDTHGENPRGEHAIALLSGHRGWTLDSLDAAAFDSWLPAFARLIPTLLNAYDQAPASDPLKARLTDQVAALRAWDDRWSATSVATSLAVYWGDGLWDEASRAAQSTGITPYDWIAERMSPGRKLQAVADASDRLQRDFGTWRTPWGEINRFQRLDDAITPRFDDARPSLPVAFTSARWGSLASFAARAYPNTRRYYGTSGNSFVAAVEFGPKVRAVAVTAGGESGHPASPHFDDQAQRYATGALRPVYFYPEDLRGHVQARYRPGEPFSQP